jgi:hypothetical protein
MFDNKLFKMLAAIVNVPLAEQKQLVESGERLLREHQATENAAPDHDAWKRREREILDFIQTAREEIRATKKRLRGGGPIVTVDPPKIWIGDVQHPIETRECAMILHCLTERLGDMTFRRHVLAMHPEILDPEPHDATRLKLSREVDQINKWFKRQVTNTPSLIRTGPHGAYWIAERDL